MVFISVLGLPMRNTIYATFINFYALCAIFIHCCAICEDEENMDAVNECRFYSRSFW